MTPVDFVTARFRSARLSLFASIVMMVALSNYLLAQLMAMGRALQGLAGAYGEVAYLYGVCALALIMLIYGTLGGIRAIAWTDAIQGGALLVGFIALLGLLVDRFGPLSAATDTILRANNAAAIAPPKAPMLREWLSYIVVVGMGGALYPQAIQRIYAASTRRALSRSLAVLAMVLRDQASLINLLDRKFDLLVQLVPAFIVGLHTGRLRAEPTLYGLAAGVAVSLLLAFGPFPFVVDGKVWNVHPGLYGLVVNAAVAFVGSRRSAPRHAVAAV